MTEEVFGDASVFEAEPGHTQPGCGENIWQEIDRLEKEISERLGRIHYLRFQLSIESGKIQAAVFGGHQNG